jgi:hypothetical protein
MPAADDDFRDFVAGFAEPLTRLAALLVVDSSVDTTSVEAAERLAIAALARTKRDWQDASTAPESHAVEALVSRLPRARPSDTSVGVDFPNDDPEIRQTKAAVWRSWCALDPRHRAPLLFVDPTVASRRFEGAELPRSFASPRKLRQLAVESDERFRFAVAQDDATAGRVDAVVEHWLSPTLADVAVRISARADARERVDAELGRLRWKTRVAVAAVIAVLAGGLAVAATVSQPDRPAAAQASSPAERPAGQTLGVSAGRVVDWPTRGNLSDDAELLASLRTAFVAAHPDALGDVQVLLAADTTWFRLAYLTSPSPDGVIGAWFYGPVGAHVLAEGAFQRGADVAEDGVVASAVADPAGHVVLVVIAPPRNIKVQWSNVESLSAPDPPRGADQLESTNGITIHDVQDTYLPAVRLVVHVGDAEPWSGPVPEVRLTSNSVAQIPIQRGFADATVLGAAIGTAHRWQQTGAFGSTAEPKVVWGGTDELGDIGVVLRMASPQLSDLLVVSWLSDRQRAPQSRAYRIDATSSDTPLVFFYPARDGTRVGVIAPDGVATAVLVVDGKASSPMPIDGAGFASLPVRGQTGLLAEQTVEVQFLASSGKALGDPVIPDQPLFGAGDD